MGVALTGMTECNCKLHAWHGMAWHGMAWHGRLEDMSRLLNCAPSRYRSLTDLEAHGAIKYFVSSLCRDINGRLDFLPIISS